MTNLQGLIVNDQAFEKYFEQLTENSLLLTPNSRLARTLHEHYAVFKQKQDVVCWQKPNILSINAWLESLRRDYLATAIETAPSLLNSAQASVIWKSIVSSDKSHDLLQISETADALKTAWELLCQFDISLDNPLFQLTSDYALCHHWLEQYQLYCHEHNYIDSATLVNFLIEKIKAGDVRLPEEIFLYGFTEMAPQVERLVGSHLAYTHRDGCRRDATPVTIALPDLDSEIIAMARFAKATHETNPEATIGCVVLDLNQRRDRVLQLFTQVFFPEQPFDVDPSHYPFNLSAGKSLSSYPLIAAALLITGLTKAAMTREHFSSLLLSPYIGEAELESAERATLDAELRRNNIHQVTLAFPSVSNTPALQQRINKLLERLDYKKRTYFEWSQYFNNMLSVLGWPGEKSLSSEEYQVAQAWLTALADFATLDRVAPAASHIEAWQQLKLVVHAQIFQPQSPKTNIQVLGLLEAAAVPFDYLWIAGMNDLSWPPQPNPHPFIPKPLQRQLNMPHATAERELRFCSTLLEQFQTSAGQLIFSHAESDGKIEYKTSALLQHLPDAELSSLAQSTYTEPASVIFANKQSETFVDTQAPDITPQQKITGGADVIKQQAACPFRAFAMHRLKARELEASTQGLNAKDRGNILHRSLETLWNEIKSQEKLLALDHDALQVIINAAIDTALIEAAPAHHHETYYISLEKQRLNKILNQWLQIEKARPSFVVSTHEQDANIALQGHSLSVRIDRIDTLADGRKLIIDYKSGKTNSTNKWFGDRPDEPQLPLYALIDSANTAGITFAQLASGSLGFKGISDSPLEIKGIDAEIHTWDEKLQKWHTTFEKLMHDFCHGEASVNPKRPSDTCKHCAITPLCRIHEISDPTCEDETNNEEADNE